ncbi:prolyl oligopeptidase family serine peptidase [Helcococcus kunzii]|uniref:prolyl oligopeptidase family serine peptidase n=1 Tax=Helcococcus kunzii TaxID=40091 RepID=UPI001C975DCB|nr:prolyl oligopeptidase family serine peptidase [Helcococcus kunzii]QZO76072.1 prolyl oligopeptidase family serine peptidase [Helcococcus kunzii]
MKKFIKIFSTLMVLSLFFVACAKQQETNEESNMEVSNEESKPMEYKGKQKVIVEGFDWGPAVVKTVIELDKNITADKINKEDFSMIERKEAFDWEKFEKEGKAPDHIISENPRTIEDVYLSDENGEKTTDKEGKYITIQTKATPNEGNPLIFSMNTSLNTWCDPFEQEIKIKEESKIGKLDVEASIDLKDDEKMSIPSLDEFTYGEFTASDGKKLTYADYKPEAKGEKKPLVIWLHGAGEGGNDPRLPIIGNMAANYAKEEFQSKFENGAYVLAPQTPTFWMDTGNGKVDLESVGAENSIYIKLLKELIDKYIADNTDIDTNRILVGGCSNGGFMTYDLISTYPDFFAAAFPVCPPYEAKNFTDEEILNMKNVPIWMIYAKNDTTVDPKIHEYTVNEVFEKTGFKDYRQTVFDDVHDLSGNYKDEEGKSYQYNGHWSWIYVHNNDVKSDDGTTLFDWLAKQSR